MSQSLLGQDHDPLAGFRHHPRNLRSWRPIRSSKSPKANPSGADLIQTNADGPVLLYHNVTDKSGNWIELKLVGTQSNRDGIGARVRVEAGGLTQIREMDGGNGYAGESTRRIHFGLGTVTRIDHLEIRRPSGRTQQVTVPLNRLSYIEEGRGVINK